MELPNYLKVIKKRWLVIVLTTILVAAGSLIFTRTQATMYEGSASLLITPISSIGKEDTPYYQFDSYYSIQAGQLYVGTVASLLNSPGLISEIYQRAGLNFNISKLKDVDKIVKVSSGSGTISNMVVNLKISHSNKDELERLFSTAVEVTKEKSQEYNSQSQQKITFNVSGTSPIIVESQPNLLLNGLIGLVAGFILGIFLAYIREYFFRKEE